MDRLRLKECLEAAGVPEDRYLLVGVDPPRAVREGACIVRPNQRAWEVLIWEPARLAALLSFLNEDQACGYALDVLTTAAKPPVEAADQPAQVALDVLTTTANPPVEVVGKPAPVALTVQVAQAGHAGKAGPGVEPAPAAVETVAQLAPMPRTEKTPLKL
jgi:hypothetical protein